MIKKTILLSAIIFSVVSLKAQYESYVRQGEIGLAVGAGHYFGDLNTRAALNRPKFSAGAFFIKQFNNYIGVKVEANYSQLGYSDVYSKNETQKLRNLSFNSNMWELAASGQFNFFKFLPGVAGYNYTPYVSLGVGVFTYDPYAYLADQKYFLRPLGTEGQGSTDYPDRKPYNTMAVCFPLTVGLKYSYTENTNFFAEIGYRFTNTDYLDDVSATYAGPTNSNFIGADQQPNAAFFLQDRSYEYTATPIGIKDRQRGNSQQKDAYILAHIGVSFNLTSYRCPTSK